MRGSAWSLCEQGGSTLSLQMSLIDWFVLAAYLLGTTWLGKLLAGKQSTIREFFLAGRKIPWLAVAGSNIATEISAVTLISVPAMVYAAGGNLTYLQLSLGALLARIIIAIWFVPAFYEREIYSPYDYMANWLGAPVRNVTAGLFVLGAVLGQSVRVYLTALVLQLITGMPLTAAIWLIGAAAVVWTLMGGITTVIWTDVIQFFVFLGGMIVAVMFVLWHVPGGWSEIVQRAEQAPGGSKLQLLNLGAANGGIYGILQQEFTLWAGLIANTVVCLAVYGTDQMMAQRMFCCRGKRPAQLAMIFSSAALGVTVVALLVGLGLYAFYEHFPLNPRDAALVSEKGDRIFPIFVLRQMPPGVAGLIIAGIFAAAISTLDGVLVALSQVAITGVYRPWRETRLRPARPLAEAEEDPHYVDVSKVLVVLWAVLLCGMAQVAILAQEKYQQILQLALAMATYTGGTLLAGFLLAFWRMNVDYRGIVFAAPLSVLSVLALTWHQPWARWVTAIGVTAVILTWLFAEFTATSRSGGGSTRRVPVLALGAALPLLLAFLQFSGEDGKQIYITAAWPWNVPLGFLVAFGLGYGLAHPRPTTEVATQRPESSG